MNWAKSLGVCAIIVLLGYVSLSVRAQAPGGAESPKATPKADQPLAEKPIPADVSNRAEAESKAAQFCQCVGQGDSAAAKAIESELAATLHSPGLKFVDQPLSDVVTQLSDEYGIPMRIDGPALDEAGIGMDSPVTLSLHNISLRSALRQIFHNLQLTWIIKDEVLMVTTHAEADKHFDTCVYNVQGLVDDSDPKSVKALIDAIYACVATETWAANGGGQAEIRPLPSGLLVVSHTPAVQEEVGTLLNKIRKMREQVPLTKVGPRGYEAPAKGSSSGIVK